jgi:pyrimidine operon attenuation protein / uracil phosphoribosyltransferase
MTRTDQLLSAQDMQRKIQDMADQIGTRIGSPVQLALVGIRTHGVTIATRIRDILKRKKGWDVPLGMLDITFYRDDLARRDQQPVAQPTRLDFDLNGKVVVLVDDVLYTGRTVRCALDQLMDYGRPQAIRLAIHVDRGLRELPIQADFTGVSITTTPAQKVQVRMMELDNEDGVSLITP